MVMRKLASTSSPEMTISVEGDVIKIVIKSLVMTREENIKLGEEYESDMRGVTLNVSLSHTQERSCSVGLH